MTRDEMKEVVYEVLFEEGVLLAERRRAGGATAELSGNVLTGEGDVTEDPQELVIEDLADWAGVPLAAGYDGAARPIVSEPLAEDAGTFSQGGPSGQLVNPREALGDLVTEALRRKQRVDVNGEPYEISDLVPSL